MFVRFFSIVLLGAMACFPCFAEDEKVPLMDEEDLNFNLTEDAFGNKIEVEEVDEPPALKIDASRSLSQNLKQNSASDDFTQDVKERAGAAQNWVKNFFKSKDRKADSIQSLLKENKLKAKTRRSNAAVFDISGNGVDLVVIHPGEALLQLPFFFCL